MGKNLWKTPPPYHFSNDLFLRDLELADQFPYHIYLIKHRPWIYATLENKIILNTTLKYMPHSQCGIYLNYKQVFKRRVQCEYINKNNLICSCQIPYILVYKSNFLDVKMGSKNRPRLIFGRTWDIPTESQKKCQKFTAASQVTELSK